MSTPEGAQIDFLPGGTSLASSPFTNGNDPRTDALAFVQSPVGGAV